MKVTVKYRKPSEKRVIEYLECMGYPDLEYKDDFLNPAKDSEQQFWQAVYENIDICDFDRWRYFQKVIGHELSWNLYRKFGKLFYENDIEVMEMPCDPKLEHIW